MSDASPAGSTPRLASPWPLFVALGLALSEVGVVLGLRPVSVAGLLLFSGSVAGILADSGYVSHPARAGGATGVALVLVGGALLTVHRAGTTFRGRSIVIAGVATVAGALLWAVLRRRRSSSPRSE